jgi:hypothetical protein
MKVCAQIGVDIGDWLYFNYSGRLPVLNKIEQSLPEPYNYLQLTASLVGKYPLDVTICN